MALPTNVKRSKKARRSTETKTVERVVATPVAPAEPAAAPLPDVTDLDPDSGLRPIDYRWSLARRLAANALVPRSWIDPWVVLGARLLTAPPGAVHDDPALAAVAAARALAAADWPRVAVETRLLAGESVDAIAAKEGLTPAAVAAYEALHCAVTDMLSAPGYIIHRAAAPNGPLDPDIRVHVRSFGYTSGPLVADAVLATFTHPPPGPDAPLEVRRRHRMIRIVVEFLALPCNDRNYGKLSRFFFLGQEHERRVGRHARATDATREV